MSPIRILVADDHPIVRDGLVAILNTQADFEVVGEVANGRETLRHVESLKPDVVLLDLEMPELDGVQTLQQLQAGQQQAKVIVFTAYDTDERIVGAVRAGAKGYLLKGAPREELFEAIRVVSAGGSLLQPVVASKLMEHMSGRGGEASGAEALTLREREVLRLMAQGRPNKEIAGKLYISERTVKFHVSSILGKLGATNRTEAVKLAARQGLVDLKE